MLTKEQINQTSPERLAEWVAVSCMGCEVFPDGAIGTLHEVIDMDGNRRFHEIDWQPHLPTEKGKAQAIDLAEKYKLEICFSDLLVHYRDFSNPYMVSGCRYSWETIFWKDVGWQTAVLKACILSEVEK